jgi:phage/plasmid-like protein (TIGR03299 family)
MSHDLEIKSDGVASMFFAGETPWHGLGVAVPQNVKSDEAMKLAGLDWTVSLKDVYAHIPGMDVPEVLIEDKKAVVRDSDGKIMGLVGDGYACIQNGRSFNFMDAIIGLDKAWFHTAGALKGGRHVWMLVEIPGDIVVNRTDVSKKFILLSTSHDGTRALQAMFTTVRCVCQNTVTAALANAKNAVTVRHTKNHEVKLGEAIRILQAANNWFTAFQADATMLSEAAFTEAKMKLLADYLFPSDETDPEKIPQQTLTARETMIKLFHSGKGNKGETAWDALNGCTEYMDWFRGTRGKTDADRKSNRLDSIWFGTGADLKEKALNGIKLLLSGKELPKTKKADD